MNQNKADVAIDLENFLNTSTTGRARKSRTPVAVTPALAALEGNFEVRVDADEFARLLASATAQRKPQADRLLELFKTESVAAALSAFVASRGGIDGAYALIQQLDSGVKRSAFVKAWKASGYADMKPAAE